MLSRRMTAIALGVIGMATSVDAEAPAQTAAQTIPGWDALVDGLRDLPAKMLAKLTPEQRADPQIRAELGRLAIESLTSSGFDAIAGDGDFPVFTPQIGQILNIGQPNADTIYRGARITPGGTYRLRGHKGSLRMMMLAQSGTPARPTHSFADLHTDANGGFDLILSPVRPEGYKGDWWPLAAGTTRLLLRLVSADWGHEQDATIAIERIDTPAQRPRTDAAELERRLRLLPQATAFSATMFIDHVEQLRAQGTVNALKIVDLNTIGGLTGQTFYEGAYDLRDDEALILETKMPGGCTYSSLILTNDIYETTDWINNHSSLNDAQAKPDGDGVLRVVVAGRDPGVANWMDTAGYRRGAIQGRWYGCASTPVPDVRKVALADVTKLLPPDTKRVTPAERETIVRERRAALQQRALW